MSARRLLSAWALATVAALGLGCAKPQPDPHDVAPRGEAVLVVDNQGFLDMNIYLVRAGNIRQRIGTAKGLGRTQFVLRTDVIGGGTDLQFLADPIGGRRTPVSQQIYVRPGDVIELQIPPG
jgi:hypothetical protein